MLQPGETGQLSVTWRVGERTGKVSDAVTILASFHNDLQPIAIRKSLSLTAIVIPEVSFNPNQLTISTNHDHDGTISVSFQSRHQSLKVLTCVSEVLGLTVAFSAETNTIHYQYRSGLHGPQSDRPCIRIMTNNLCKSWEMIPILLVASKEIRP
jgi:hypothetical protein